MDSIDFARYQFRDEWLHHYAIGDPSWDTFVREPGNPIYVGHAPYEWPVNGFLFHDPPTGRWYAFVGLYPRGYWPAGPCLALREGEKGEWEQLGLAVEGNPTMFDGDGTRPGAMPDVSIVYADGHYHMVYDWANPANSQGGLAYAWSERPEGPYHRSNTPIHIDTLQTPILSRYVRSYAATLIKRDHDWIILHDMSTPGNAGGTWAMACMTAKDPAGPYSAPTLLLYPQSDIFLEPFMEYYPAFAHEGYIYAPATSVAQNRNFQCIFRAPIEQAHCPDAWELYLHGSVWHAEFASAEEQGIWGQTFSAQVDDRGLMRAYFTSKTRADIGTVHIAQRAWNRPYQDGFILSAPNSPAFGILRHWYRTFHLKAVVHATNGWSLRWQCQAPFGPDTPGWNPAAHATMYAHGMQWHRCQDNWSLTLTDGKGNQNVESGVCAIPDDRNEEIELIQEEQNATLILNGRLITTFAREAVKGGLQLVAEKGTVLHVDRFAVEGTVIPSAEYWLSTEALAGAATGMDANEWQPITDAGFRYGFGYVSARNGARAKWNYHGSGFRIFAPRRPGFGQMAVYIDGQNLGLIDLHAVELQPSAPVCERCLPRGYHAVVIESSSGMIPCDCLEINPDV